jgi:hypothetical protein
MLTVAPKHWHRRNHIDEIAFLDQTIRFLPNYRPDQVNIRPRAFMGAFVPEVRQSLRD